MRVKVWLKWMQCAYNWLNEYEIDINIVQRAKGMKSTLEELILVVIYTKNLNILSKFLVGK